MSMSPLQIVAPIHTPLATAHTSGTGTAQSSSSSTLNANDAESTFLNMLVTELQNQDPTSPMDPNDMVAQMFSMNQLQQLIDINQTLQVIAGGAPATSPASGAAASPSIQTPTGAH